MANNLNAGQRRYQGTIMKAARRKIAIAFIAGLVAQSPGFAFELKGEIDPAFIYFNLPNDGGWTQAFHEAKPALEAAIGKSIIAVEKVPEDNAQVTTVVERLIQRGKNVIIGTAYGYSDPFLTLSKKYPDVAFMNANGTTNGPNLGSFYGRTYQSQYLCGMVAGAMSKTGKLGFVAANPIGSVVWSVNAYALGAQSVNPDATVSVVYTGAWNDPVKERQAASALIDQGADVIGQGVDTPTSQIVAQERGVYSTANWRDMSEFAPKANLCSQKWVWAEFLGPQLEAIKAGTWQPSQFGDFSGIDKAGTDIACCNEVVPADVVAKVKAVREEIIAGKDVFAGPLKDREGKERVASGAHLTDADLWAMDWYVPGVSTSQ